MQTYNPLQGYGFCATSPIVAGHDVVVCPGKLPPHSVAKADNAVLIRLLAGTPLAEQLTPNFVQVILHTSILLDRETVASTSTGVIDRWIINSRSVYTDHGKFVLYHHRDTRRCIVISQSLITPEISGPLSDAAQVLPTVDQAVTWSDAGHFLLASTPDSNHFCWGADTVHQFGPGNIVFFEYLASGVPVDTDAASAAGTDATSAAAKVGASSAIRPRVATLVPFWAHVAGAKGNFDHNSVSISQHNAYVCDADNNAVCVPPGWTLKQVYAMPGATHVVVPDATGALNVLVFPESPHYERCDAMIRGVCQLVQSTEVDPCSAPHSGYGLLLSVCSVTEKAMRVAAAGVQCPDAATEGGVASGPLETVEFVDPVTGESVFHYTNAKQAGRGIWMPGSEPCLDAEAAMQAVRSALFGALKITLPSGRVVAGEMRFLDDGCVLLAPSNKRKASVPEEAHKAIQAAVASITKALGLGDNAKCRLCVSARHVVATWVKQRVDGEKYREYKAYAMPLVGRVC